MRRGVALAAGIAGVVGSLSGVSAAQATQLRPGPAVCPAGVGSKATCYTGQDANGAYYAIAVPEHWNGSLVVHAHGGPDLGEGSDPERSIDDLDRWSVMVDEGYAWAGSSYRRGRFSVFTFRDIVHNRLGDRNPFSNKGVRYSGSHDDKALDAGVERFSADPDARRDLSYDSDLTGRVSMPVLTMHAIDDPTAFIEHEAAYRASREGAHRESNLVQTFTGESEHSALSDSEYANSIAALAGWVRTGRRPTPQSVASSCASFDRTYGTGCFYDSDFRPSRYASRVLPRPGGLSWPAMTVSQEEAWSRINGVGIAP
ncbi:hypothetical protein ACFYPC_26685 [Streptomyces sp. NPDC005808]|uniref:hypothetical protein n=1 Tax=Streptomyces sp. NPDC005808 TaxID=3364734 RepID=UPI00367D6237